MIGEILAEHPWLGPLVWQSTLGLAAGLGGSFLLRRHAVRAHQVLLLGLVAAVLLPALREVVKRNQWGLLVVERAVSLPQYLPVAPTPEFAIPDEPITTEPTNTPSLARDLKAAPAPPSTPFEWTRVIVPAWLALSSVLLLRLTVQFLRGRRLTKRSEEVEDVQLLHLIEDTKDKLGLRTEVRVRASAQARSPVLWCWSRRPILLIPPESRSDPNLDWPSIFCHELAHAKRRDHVSGLLAELMVCMLPWQPLAWWAKQRLAALSEEACDDWVIACGQRASGYARTLLGLIPEGRAALLPGVVTSRRGLAGRVRRIIEDGCGNPHPGLTWTVSAAALAVCLCLGLAFAQTRPAPRNPSVQEAPPKAGAQPTAEQTATHVDQILLRLVDPNGRPVAGAKVGSVAFTLAFSPFRTQVGWQPATASSDENGQVTLDAESYFSGRAGNKIAVYILHEERRIGAVHEVVRRTPQETLPVVLRPVCRVHGTCDSAGLAALGMPLREIFVNVLPTRDAFPLLYRGSNDPNHGFEFLLPPGTYTLRTDGSGHQGKDPPFVKALTEYQNLPITIPAELPDLDVGVLDLRPTKWSTMIGHPAPAVGPMKAWKNGSAVTLSDLRGQIVWLRFAERYDAAFPDLPQLVELDEALGRKGLTIIMISNWSSLEEFDQGWSKTSGELSGGVREIPFRIAIDGDAAADREGTGKGRVGATFERYGIVRSHTDILIDPAGNVVGRPGLSRAKEAIAQMLAARQEWRQRFDEVYRLAEGEVLKRIAPPFIPERLQYYQEMRGNRAAPRDFNRIVGLTFHWDGGVKLWGEGPAFSKPLGNFLRSVLRMQSYEYEGAPELLDAPYLPPGDWIVRDGAPLEAKLRALEGLVTRELGRRIRFEQHSVEREAVVATGRFQLHSLPQTTGKSQDKSIHVYAGDVAKEPRVGRGTALSVSHFLRIFAEDIQMPVLDRTEPGGPLRVPYTLYRSSRLQDISDEQERAKQLKTLLDNLTAQTDLQFEIRQEAVPVWFVTEPTGP